MRRQSKLTSASVRRGAPVAIFAVMTALNLSPSGAGRREENTSAISVWPVRRTLMQKHLFSSTSGNAEEEALRQVSIVGRAPSAEIDVIAETEAADRLIPSRKASRRSGSPVMSCCIAPLLMMTAFLPDAPTRGKAGAGAVLRFARTRGRAEKGQKECRHGA